MNSAKYSCVQGLHNEHQVEGNELSEVRQTSFCATGAEQTSHSRLDILHSRVFNK